MVVQRHNERHTANVCGYQSRIQDKVNNAKKVEHFSKQLEEHEARLIKRLADTRSREQVVMKQLESVKHKR